MMLLRLLNPQGIAGLAAALCLAILLVIQKGETRHWRKQSIRFEQLHRDSEAERARMVADFAAAAETARAADRANASRVAAEQGAINQRSNHDFEARIARARAAAQRLRQDPAPAQDRGHARGAAMPGLPAAPARAAQAAGQDRLPDPDQRARKDRGALGPEDALIATEQAIQLDELIRWVRAQGAIDPNAQPPAE